MGEKKMLKLCLLSQVGSLIYNFCREKSSIDRKKTVTSESDRKKTATSEKCNTHNQYHSVKRYYSENNK